MDSELPPTVLEGDEPLQPSGPGSGADGARAQAPPPDSRRFTPADTVIQESDRHPQLADSRRFTPQDDTQLHDLPPLGGPPPDSRRFTPPDTVIQDSERLQGVDETWVRSPVDASSEPGPDSEDGELPVADGRVAHYRLRKELARGGMGAVYLAYHPRLKREVALKVMLAGRDASAKQLQRFQREAEAAGRLQHPGIVAVHDVGHDRGLHYLVMDLVQGPSLDVVLRDEGPLEPRRAAEIARALAEALAYAHSRAVLHRDMKPANVLLDPERGPRITDFGLAKTTDVEDELTKAGAILGTPAYMPPEQARGDPQQVDRRADVYSLGATLYAMLTGAAPFKGQPVKVIYQVLRVDPTPVRKLRPLVDRDLETICLRCLEKDPQARYLTAGELAEDLARYLAHQPIRARPPSPRERLSKWVRRNRALATVIASSALLLVGVGAAALVVLPQRERAQVAAEARDAARRSADAAAAADPLALGPPLAALQAAQRWRDLDRADPAAAEALFAAASRLGEVALAGEQWELAQQCFSQARELDVDDSAADAALARVTAARERLALERREAVLAVLARAREGELAQQSEGLLDGVFSLVRYPEPQTVALLSAELDDVAARLLDAQRSALAELQAEVELERPALAATCEAREQLAGRELAPPAARGAYQAALDALAREREQSRAELMRQLGARQRAALGPRLDAATIACRALARIGLDADAERALCFYLTAEADADRALEAARALVRQRSARGRPFLEDALTEFGPLSRFGKQVRPLLARWGSASVDPNSAAQLWARGMQRMQDDDLAGAREDFLRVVTLEPQHAGGWANLAAVLASLGDTSEAARAYDTALRLDPDDAHLTYNRASFLQREGDLAGARAGYARAIELAPGVALFHRELGKLLQDEGDLDGAARCFDEALRLDPADPETLVARGDCAYAREELSLALADYERALAVDPRHAAALKSRGWVRRMQGDPEAALRDLTLALEVDPGDGHAWDMRGNVLIDLGDPAGAREAFTRALELGGDPVGPRVRRGFAHLGLEAWEAALADFDGALAQAPDLLPALSGRADALRILERYDEAVAAYDALLVQAPTNWPAWNARGVCLWALDRFAEAVESYERALALEPTVGTLWFNKGESLAADGRWIQALEAFDEALEREPTLFDALLGRAGVHAHEGRHALAKDDASAALELDPQSVPALLARGRALRALGEREAARADLERARGLAPDDADVAAELASLDAE